KSIEVGHPAYQHPQRARDGAYGLEIDRFSHLVIYTALHALIRKGRPLWEKFDNGDNLLFRQQDLAAPEDSELFAELLKADDRGVRRLAEELQKAAKGPIDKVPLLHEVAPNGSITSAVPDRKKAGKGTSTAQAVTAAEPVPMAVPVERVEDVFAEAMTA